MEGKRWKRGKEGEDEGSGEKATKEMVTTGLQWGQMMLTPMKMRHCAHSECFVISGGVPKESPQQSNVGSP